jgi:glutathione S-transferase
LTSFHYVDINVFVNSPNRADAIGDPKEAIMAVDPNADIEISAFQWVPGFAQGQVRDLRPRWALEEAGLPYKTRLLAMGDQDKPDYRALQPFGQVPIFREGGLALFESGAIVLHIGKHSEALLPSDESARARATQWLIAALNSIEPFVMEVARIDLFFPEEEWAQQRRPAAVEFLERRLASLSKSLGDKPYLDGDRFTVGDLVMTTVLRILPEITAGEPRLVAYVERCTARPAFQRALDAQLAPFKAHEPADAA